MAMTHRSRGHSMPGTHASSLIESISLRRGFVMLHHILRDPPRVLPFRDLRDFSDFPPAPLPHPSRKQKAFSCLTSPIPAPLFKSLKSLKSLSCAFSHYAVPPRLPRS